ncbi:MAG: hypothetical protein M0027_12515 [Candidatus Dormibacteraeota bacterium]|nr:hypothetical protein [Candidatus Dormibacteraeota bacterium]
MPPETTTHEIHFSVDGEDVSTPYKTLTADQVLRLAGDNPAERYLVLVEGRHQTSYKDRGGTEIELHDKMTFVTASLGPTPTS